jgi:hypothetical protein
MKQTILTFISRIDPAKRTALDGLLKLIQKDLDNNSLVPFSRLDLLHFASFVLMDNTAGETLLVFENNFDGDLPAYLTQLLIVAGNGLHRIYGCCPDYNGNSAQLKAFLTDHIVRPNAFHIGNVGRTAVVIHENLKLREALEVELDGNNNTGSPGSVRHTLQAFAQTLPGNLSAALPPHQTFSEKFLPWVHIVLAVAVLIVPFLLIVLPGMWYLRRLERGEKPDSGTINNAEVTALMAKENLTTQNHLASITQIKPGWFRLQLLRFVLFAANLLARTSNKGKLSGIPSIHFAHWSIVENKQLLFLSNFDGSWSSYLDDFIDKAAKGLTGIWSNTAGFPKTRLLVNEGATDELRFKAFARNSQVPSTVWYSAYTALTVQNIDKDSAIREGLVGELAEADTKKWLKLF